MTINVGFADRLVRLALAGVLFSFFFFATEPIRYIGLLGIVPLLTGSMGWCPLYSLFGIRTCPVR